MKKFNVGGVYYARSIADYECIWSYAVVSRTAKTATLRDVDTGEERRARIITEQGEECIYPLGRYSMAPVLRAGRHY